jgi:hypothetical protein
MYIALKYDCQLVTEYFVLWVATCINYSGRLHEGNSPLKTMTYENLNVIICSCWQCNCCLKIKQHAQIQDRFVLKQLYLGRLTISYHNLATSFSCNRPDNLLLLMLLLHKGSLLHLKRALWLQRVTHLNLDSIVQDHQVTIV